PLSSIFPGIVRRAVQRLHTAERGQLVRRANAHGFTGHSPTMGPGSPGFHAATAECHSDHWPSDISPPDGYSRSGGEARLKERRRLMRATAPVALTLGDAPGKWVIAAAVLGSGMAGVDATVVNIALPALGRDLHAGFDGLQWTINGYTLALASLILLGGSLGGRF